MKFAMTFLFSVALALLLAAANAEDTYYMCELDCPDNCATCLSGTVCTECDSGYVRFLNQAGDEVSCADASSCNQETDCVIYEDTDNDGACGAGECYECDSGKVVMSGSCDTCTDIANCLDYTDVNTDGCASSDTCNRCEDGYGLDSGSDGCTECTATNCKTCAGATPATCTACNVGYYLDNGNCEECDDACSDAGCTATGATACSSGCADGYADAGAGAGCEAVNNQAESDPVACLANCKECEEGEEDTCAETKCADGHTRTAYTPDSDSGVDLVVVSQLLMALTTIYSIGINL